MNVPEQKGPEDDGPEEDGPEEDRSEAGRWDEAQREETRREEEAPAEAAGPDAGAKSSEAVRIRRVPARGAYDRATIDAILDEGLVAHVGTVREGTPVVIPMFYVRDGDRLLLHGAPATGAIRRGADTEVCVTVTLLDGLVLARSAFHHSMNYRSVVVIGTATPVEDPVDKEAALERFVEALLPGRQGDLRPTTPKETAGTGLLEVALATASAKVRTGGPVDDDEDYELPIWAGVIPVHTILGSPEPDPRNLPGVALPDNVAYLAG